MKALFITGSGTGVGKTFVAAALLHQLRAAGKSPFALKPVATGFREGDPDSDPVLLLGAMGRAADAESLARVSPWRYADPLSPDQAARKEGRPVEGKALLEFCRAAVRKNPLTLVEGIGGAFTPLGNGFLVADWIRSLRMPFLFVAGSYLGTLTHTLGAIEALAARRLKPKAVIVSQAFRDPVPLRESAASLAANLKDIRVFPLPHLAGANAPAKAPDLLHLLK